MAGYAPFSKIEKNNQRPEAMNELLHELDMGVQSAGQDGWINEEDFKEHFMKILFKE